MKRARHDTEKAGRPVAVDPHNGTAPEGREGISRCSAFLGFWTFQTSLLISSLASRGLALRHGPGASRRTFHRAVSDSYSTPESMPPGIDFSRKYPREIATREVTLDVLFYLVAPDVRTYEACRGLCHRRIRHGCSGTMNKLLRDSRLCCTSRLQAVKARVHWPCNIELRLNVTGDKKIWRILCKVGDCAQSSSGRRKLQSHLRHTCC